MVFKSQTAARLPEIFLSTSLPHKPPFLKCSRAGPATAVAKFLLTPRTAVPMYLVLGGGTIVAVAGYKYSLSTEVSDGLASLHVLSFGAVALILAVVVNSSERIFAACVYPRHFARISEGSSIAAWWNCIIFSATVFPALAVNAFSAFAAGRDADADADADGNLLAWLRSGAGEGGPSLVPGLGAEQLWVAVFVGYMLKDFIKKGGINALFGLHHAVCILGGIGAMTLSRGLPLFVAACTVFEAGNTMLGLNHIFPKSHFIAATFWYTNFLSNIVVLGLAVLSWTLEGGGVACTVLAVIGLSLSVLRTYFTWERHDVAARLLREGLREKAE